MKLRPFFLYFFFKLYFFFSPKQIISNVISLFLMRNKGCHRRHQRHYFFLSQIPQYHMPYQASYDKLYSTYFVPSHFLLFSFYLQNPFPFIFIFLIFHFSFCQTKHFPKFLILIYKMNSKCGQMRKSWDGFQTNLSLDSRVWIFRSGYFQKQGVDGRLCKLIVGAIREVWLALSWC